MYMYVNKWISYLYIVMAIIIDIKNGVPCNLSFDNEYFIAVKREMITVIQSITNTI